MILTLHDGTQREVRIHGQIAGLRITEVTLTLDDLKDVNDPEVLADWLTQEIYPRMVRLLAAETSSLAVEQGQRDIPTERPEGRIVGEEEIVESRGRRSTLGIPYKSGSKEYARAYYRRNREKMNERTKKWQQENKDRVQATQQSYRAATKEELHEASVPKSPRQRFEDVFGDNNDTDTNE